MPNWSNNELFVAGHPDDVAKFIEKARGHRHRFAGPFNSGYSGSYFSAIEPIKQSEVADLKAEINRLMNEDDALFQEPSVSEFSMHSLIPIPRYALLRPYTHFSLTEEQKALIDQVFEDYPPVESGFAWEVENWGVKWGSVERTEIGEYRSSWTELNREEFKDYHFLDFENFWYIYDEEVDNKNYRFGSRLVPKGDVRVVQYFFITASDIPYEFMSRLAAAWPDLYFYLQAEIEGSEYAWEWVEYCHGEEYCRDATPWENDDESDEV